MTMTLEEAIQHCYETARACELSEPEIQCAVEHRQLADWLVELQQFRKKAEPAKVVNQEEAYCMATAMYTTIGDCENCGRKVAHNLHEFCPGCGKELEWEWK